MLSTDREITEFNATQAYTPHFLVVRGRQAILSFQNDLASLGRLCGQERAAEHLEYFLTKAENFGKIPYLILVSSRVDRDLSDLRVEDLKGAVLVYEYTVLGIPSGLFSTRDFNGLRGIIAPAAIRTKISAMVCRYLAERGARVVLVTFAPDGDTFCQKCFDEITEDFDTKKQWWTTQLREVGASIALEKTMEGTLARIGRHTRRNLRYYRRKAETELGCIFESDLRGKLSMAQLKELNDSATHSVPDSVLERRLAVMNSLEGAFCTGTRTPNGQWISLLGGRRHRAVTEVDWQMNRNDVAKYSVGTVIRSFLIENEIGLGMEEIFFEGGTMHSMRHSFLSQKAVDIIVRNQCLVVYLLRKITMLFRLESNFLLQTLTNPGLKWHRR